MNKRRASRELSLIAFSQITKSVKKSDDINILEIIQKSSESMTAEAQSLLGSAVNELEKIREFIYNYEIEHPDNLERPFETSTIPVNIPLTSDMLGRIDMLFEAADRTYTAIDLTQMVSMAELEEVKEYAVNIVKTFLDHKEEIDAKISEHAKNWDVERLVKIDRDILRIAVTEILYFDDVPPSVSIHEAVELAKKYSTEESSKFINGILGSIVNVRSF